MNEILNHYYQELVDEAIGKIVGDIHPEKFNEL
jgi:hypothetical protein